MIIHTCILSIKDRTSNNCTYTLDVKTNIKWCESKTALYSSFHKKLIILISYNRR